MRKFLVVGAVSEGNTKVVTQYSVQAHDQRSAIAQVKDLGDTEILSCHALCFYSRPTIIQMAITHQPDATNPFGNSNVFFPGGLT